MRSLLAFWMGGASAVAGGPPAVVPPAAGGRKFRRMGIRLPHEDRAEEHNDDDEVMLIAKEFMNKVIH